MRVPMKFYIYFSLKSYNFQFSYVYQRVCQTIYLKNSKESNSSLRIYENNYRVHETKTISLRESMTCGTEEIMRFPNLLIF